GAPRKAGREPQFLGVRHEEPAQHGLVEPAVELVAEPPPHEGGDALIGGAFWWGRSERERKARRQGEQAAVFEDVGPSRRNEKDAFAQPQPFAQLQARWVVCDQAMPARV